MGLRQSTTGATGGGSGSGGGVPHSLPHGLPLGGPGGGGGGGSGRGSSADGLHFGDVHRRHHPPPHHQSAAAGIGGPSSQTQRHRGLGSNHRGLPVHGGIGASNGGGGGGASGSGGILGSPGSDDSTPDEDPVSRAILRSSLPVHLFSFRDIKCPVCNKLVPPDDVECHFVMCLTRPRITYNEDVLLEDKDECVICFEELFQGDTIARLPCLCIYHKRCIDQWFKVKRSCPEHPSD